MMAEQLLQHGANINVTTNKESGFTLLFQFCCNKSKINDVQAEIISEVVQFMIEHGAYKELYIKNSKIRVLDVLVGHPVYQKLRDIIENCKQIYYHPVMKPVERAEASIDRDASN